LLDKLTNFLQLIALLFSIFTRQIYYNNFLALLYMPKYTKSVRKSNMRKNKRGRSRRGGYWFYPGPGDDEHAFTKLKNNFSSGSWKFWQKKPEDVPLMPVSSDYSSTAQEPAPAMAEEAPMPEQAQPEGSLEYPAPEPAQMEQEQAPMDNVDQGVMEEKSYAPEPPVSESVAVEEPPPITGGRRRRRSRTTKKRKRSNMRRRTNKRRRSNKRRR
jgi:hypothetical protein